LKEGRQPLLSPHPPLSPFPLIRGSEREASPLLEGLRPPKEIISFILQLLTFVLRVWLEFSKEKMKRGQIDQTFLWVEILQEHIHSPQQVAPSGAPPINLASGGVAWTLGAFSADIIAAGAVAAPFDIHWAVISVPSGNTDYEVVLYYGATDIECARIKFSRTNVFVASITVPVQTVIIPANSRVRAAMMDGGGGNTISICLFYHTY